MTTSGPETNGMRAEIAVSWHRSALNGVDIGGFPALDLTEDFDRNSRLLRAAQPILDNLENELSGTSIVGVLTDPDCRIVRRVLDDAALARRMDRFRIVPGAVFSEDAVGTTSLGTPVEVRRGVAVNGGEHYLELLRGLSCYGRPVVHPVTGRIEGILDLTLEADQINPLFVPVVDRAVRDVESRLLDTSRPSQRQLFDAFQRASAKSPFGVAAVGADLLLHNDIALSLLEPTDYVTLRAIAADLGPDETRIVDIDLAGAGAARAEVQTIPGTNGGAVCVVRPLEVPAAPVRRGSNATCAARLSADIERARRSGEAVAVCGEAGSGRTSIARLIANDESADWLDASTIATDGLPQWLQQLASIATGGAVVLVIEHAESLTESVIPTLTQLIAAKSPPRVILTAGRVSDLPSSVAALVSLCPQRLEILPLRNRRLEFGQIARDMLAKLDGSWRLTPAALTALSAADWPGNLRELADVIEWSIATARLGRIEVSDLPERYQQSDRAAHLAGRERAERQAIIDALTAVGGNKVRAAVELGVSRSTLYARMRVLGIDFA